MNWVVNVDFKGHNIEILGFLALLDEHSPVVREKAVFFILFYFFAVNLVTGLVAGLSDCCDGFLSLYLYQILNCSL